MIKLYKSITSCVLFLLLCNCGSGFSEQDQLRVYDYYIKKANQYNAIEDYRTAIKYSDKAIDITDTLAIAFKVKGIALYHLNVLDDALVNFDQVISLEGEKSDVFKNRAIIHLKNDDTYFLNDIETYLDTHPYDDEAINMRAAYYQDAFNYANEMAFRTIKYN
ncbi:tetratricopeptide repeat protein [Algibacter lectus]|uniref:tetratricopeptide repeat protein n=1 Tax=Algibacter lectus TaxID=221126 RepID=UPI0026EFC9B2|nr:hypothetical protein [Algibacter lectus]MDO7138945.1 hypothetical protein [Algibacter lectus]